uniref:Transmembrane protein 216 n=1 Tax=Dromaius novaehollandiae TaxID=8790 RepID=A0A8C4KPC7_DRONO
PAVPGMGQDSAPRSSAPLQILLFLNGWYCATYFLLEAFIFVYKGAQVPALRAAVAVPATRIFFGSKGNLCQRKVPLSISLALTFPAATMAAYYLLLQTYALRLEAILNAILLVFYTAELLLGVLTACDTQVSLRYGELFFSTASSE